MSKQKSFKTPSRIVKLRVEIEHAINEALTYSGMTEQELCLSLGISAATLWRRIRNPDDLTLRELRVIAMLGGHEYSTFLSELVK